MGFISKNLSSFPLNFVFIVSSGYGSRFVSATWKKINKKMSASVASSISHACVNNFSIFEIFFDLPHPANSSDPVPARIIEPRPSEHRILQRRDVSELFEPNNISKITRFAFPGHDDRIHGE